MEWKCFFFLNLFAWFVDYYFLDSDDNLHGNEVLQQPQESINRVRSLGEKWPQKNEEDVIIIIFILWHISHFVYFLLSFTTGSSLPTVHVYSNQRQSSGIIYIFDASLTHIKNKTSNAIIA